MESTTHISGDGSFSRAAQAASRAFSGPTYRLDDGDVRAIELPAQLRRSCCNRRHRTAPTADRFGSPQLRAAFSEAFHGTTGVRPPPEQVVACRSRATGALSLALQTLPVHCNVGLFSPMWFGFPPLINAVERGLALSSTSGHGFYPTAHQLEFVITSAWKMGCPIQAVILNNFATPTGRAIPRAELEGIATVVLGHPGITVVEDCLFWRSAHPGGRFHTLAQVCPELMERDQLICCASMAKAWPMGERDLGFLWGHPNRVKRIRAIVDRDRDYPDRDTQDCVGDALVGSGRNTPDELAAELAANREALERLCANSRFRLACRPDGGTNALLDLTELVQAMFQGDSLCCESCVAQLLDEVVGVKLYPGRSFGCQFDALRVNLAGATRGQFEDAMSRLQAFSDACY